MSIPSIWRVQLPRYRLVGKRCGCGRIWFPPYEMCDCGCDRFEDYILPGEGEIVSWTVIHIPPEGFEAPYVIALVDFDGVMVTGQIVDIENIENLKIGDKVKTVFRRVYETSNGLIVYGYKFKLI